MDDLNNFEDKKDDIDKKISEENVIILEDKLKKNSDEEHKQEAPNIDSDGTIEGSYIDITEINRGNDNKMYYSETILNEDKPKKDYSGFKRFIAGILIASIVGGSMFNVGVGLVKSFKNVTATEKAAYSSDISAIPLSTNIETTSVSPASVIAKNVGPAVVGITNTFSVRDFFNKEYNEKSSGSGIIFDETDDKIFIVTNEHVITGNSFTSQQSIVVTLLGDQKVEATVVGVDAETDLAVLSVDKKDMLEESINNIVVAKFGDSSQLQVGELAVAIGNPLGEQFGNSVTQGIISGLDRKVKTTDRVYTVIQTDAAINNGNSGGALVNSKSEVIGINTLKASESGVEGMGFAIPTNIAKPIIEELMNKGYISRPYLGIVMEGTVTKQLSEIYGVPAGVMVESVIQGSSAANAGIQSGDIITAFNGEKITSTEQLSQLIKGHKVGDKVVIEIVRNGKNRMNVNVELQESQNKNTESFTQQNQQQDGSNYYNFSLPFGFWY